MELIDRQALIEHLKIHCDGCGEALHCAYDAPNLDAVPVVKCKDCIYYEKGKSYEPYCNHPTHGIPYPNDNDFCSYGERKDGDK